MVTWTASGRANHLEVSYGKLEIVHTAGHDRGFTSGRGYDIDL